MCLRCWKMSSVNNRDAPQLGESDTRDSKVATTIAVEDSNERRPSKKISMTSTGAIIREENEHSLSWVSYHTKKGHFFCVK